MSALGTLALIDLMAANLTFVLTVAAYFRWALRQPPGTRTGKEEPWEALLVWVCMWAICMAFWPVVLWGLVDTKGGLEE